LRRELLAVGPCLVLMRLRVAKVEQDTVAHGEPSGSSSFLTRPWREWIRTAGPTLTYDGNAFQNTYLTSPGCTAPEDGTGENNGMRSHQPS
jgi:hypothetical protein